MVTEQATLIIKQDLVSEFVVAIGEAFPLLINNAGYLSHQLMQSIEFPNHFLLIVQWATLEDHVNGFIGSSQFSKWEQRIKHFFSEEPTVLHYYMIQ
ncbi:antibiotic biosynthesis monooxygenase [Bacillus sp. CBEL-1]|uniref:antibiotic biosynthesis monooxygenase family protein n=1 Tax=Bacillus sp. CBEL-1 TaxID=2502980 RepID=UPI00104E07B5|nr:antibiotic biosynthesis monooxygenase [Bacillus sp. CBEL-1]TDB49675.1 antibiotic biosynthesis monooxygenase [Bacillus sp. CBEL-1]